ncbi:MAG: glycosyltransferase family 9 protein [Magnetococcales bacterium]|nr:glycosyltransferase family 9 protein [Magnetococcales bacterium]
MRQQTMRLIDEWVGQPLCLVLRLVLTGHHVLGKLWHRPAATLQKEKAVKTILLQKYFGIGSILHAIPLIRALRRRYPDARIVFVTFQPMVETIRLCSIADEIITLPTHSPTAFVAALFGTLWRLRRLPVDISIDLEFFARFTLLFSLLSGAPVRMGFFLRHIRPAALLSHPIYYNTYHHLRYIYFAFGQELGLTPNAEFFRDVLPTPSSLVESRWRDRLGLDAQLPIIVVNPNTSELVYQRRWPAGHFQKLIGRMAERWPRYQYVLVGTRSEKKYVDSIVAGLHATANKVINLAGVTTLAELFSLLGSASLVITSDSGPMHVAALYQTNLVAFFGPETPVVYGPVNTNAIVFHASHLYCSPCLNVYDAKKSVHYHPCENPLCLQAIDPDMVLNMIEERFLACPTQPSHP